MSESEKSRESEEQQEEKSQSEEEGSDEEGEEDQDEDQNQDQDEDEDQQNEEQEQQQDQQENSGENSEQEQDQQKTNKEQQHKLPSFPPPAEPFENRMSIDYISAEIASLELSVDSFINSLSSQINSNCTKPDPTNYTSTKHFSQLPLHSAGFQKTSQWSKKPIPSTTYQTPIHIKDFEMQVDMQPQIVIQNVSKLPPLQKKSGSYVINSEAESYLSKLESSGKEKDGLKFERKQDDVIDWEKRNKEIDQAMRVMKQRY